MSDVEAALREAFEHASESLMPPPDLDVLVRRATRRRRRRQAVTVVVIGGMAAGAWLAAAAATGHHSGGPPVTTRHHAGRIGTSGGGDAIAVGGRMVYLVTGDHPHAALSAYSRATGRLVRRIGIPAYPSALRIGPDGSVWLAFYPDQHGGGTGVWRLTPDLVRRSGINLGARRYFGAAPFDIVVRTANTAVLGTDHGVAALRLPTPGAAGRPVLHWRRVPPGVRQGYPVGVFSLAGHVAVRWATDDGRTAITVIGRPGLVRKHTRGFVAAEANGLWLTLRTQSGVPTGTLIRLDRALRDVTPRAIRANPVLARPELVLAHGSTVWVLRSGSRALACFTYSGGHAGPVAVVRTGFQVDEIAPADSTVYVLNSIGVASYPVPASCRPSL